MSNRKSIEDLKDTITLLEDNIKQYHAGKREYYRLIALHLWTLLCDTSKGKPLIRRLYPAFYLHPLRGSTPEGNEDPPLWQMHKILGPTGLLFPVMVYGRGKRRPTAKMLFEEDREPIKLSKWLDQPLLNQEITILKFIARVRHKMGTHSDPEYDDLLSRTRSLYVVGVQALELTTVTLREYVLKQVKALASK